MKPALIALAGLVALSSGSAKAAVTFGATYFTIAGTYNGPGSGDPDFNTIGCCTATFYDEVKTSLGPDGLPVYNPASAAPTIHDVNAAGEITWWSPTLNPYVQLTGTGTITTPYANYNFFPPNGTGPNDSSGFQGAIFSGVFTLLSPEQVSFSFGADDDAFLAVDSTIIAQEGGIHSVSAAPASSAVLDPGVHSITLFYVDRNVTGAGLYFDVTTQDIVVAPPPSPVPEPASIALLLAGVTGVVAMRRRSVS